MRQSLVVIAALFLLNLTCCGDSEAPTKVVSSAGVSPAGHYGVGDAVRIALVFSDQVTVEGTPHLELNIVNEEHRFATHIAGSGTEVLTFEYIVRVGDNETDLNYLSPNSLSLNGGDIVDTHHDDVDLTLPEPKSAYSLAVDGKAPFVQELAVLNSDNHLTVGNSFIIQATFSEKVTVENTPTLILSRSEGDTRTATYVSGSNTATLSFVYTVQAGDSPSVLNSFYWMTINIDNAKVYDQAKNFATLDVDGAASVPFSNDLGALPLFGEYAKISYVDSLNSSGLYRAGESIDITVAFDKAVLVHGTPILQLETGKTEAAATYVSGSGTSLLHFRYVVHTGDFSEALNYQSIDALAGTFTTAEGYPVDLLLPELDSFYSLQGQKILSVDAVAPTVVKVSTSLPSGTYGVGTSIAIQVVFSEPVALTGNVNIELATGVPGRQAPFHISRSEYSTILDFYYPVEFGDNIAALDYTNIDALVVQTGSIEDQHHNVAQLTLPEVGSADSIVGSALITLDGIRPRILSVTSDKPNGTYGIGEIIPVTVQFSKKIYVSDTPSLVLDDGRREHYANYSSGSGTSSLQLNYTVTSGVNTSRLNYYQTYSLTGRIVDVLGNTADLNLPGLDTVGSLSGSKTIGLDTTAPVVSRVTSSTPDGTYTIGKQIDVQVQFNEAVKVSGTPQLSLDVGVAKYVSGSESSTLTFTYSVKAADYTSQLRYYSFLNPLTVVGAAIKDSANNSANLSLPDGATSLMANSYILIETFAADAPSNLVLTPGNQSVTLTWTKGYNSTGYLVARSDTAPVQWVPVAGTNYTVGENVDANVVIANVGTSTLFAENGLIPSATYYYQLYAFDSVRNYSSGLPGSVIVGGWGPSAYLKASNHQGSDTLGRSVAISGDTVAVGAPLESGNYVSIIQGDAGYVDVNLNQAGAAYIYRTTGGTWAQEAYIKAPNAGSNDSFGYAIAISGDSLVVGAPYEDGAQSTISNGTIANSDPNATFDSGAAYVFKRNGTSWAYQAYLKAANANQQQYFGTSVGIESDTIVVGATGESSKVKTVTNGTTASSDVSVQGAGAAYVFKRGGQTWMQQAYLKSPNSDYLGSFGSSVTISGDTIAVGAQSEYGYYSTILNGTSEIILAGLPLAGTAYVFKRTGVSWRVEASLNASNVFDAQHFGNSLALASDTLVVGAHYESGNQRTITNGTTATSDRILTNSGAAYVYKRSGTLWTQEAYLKASNAGFYDYFGTSVAITGDTIVVGAVSEGNGQTTVSIGTEIEYESSKNDSGAAYIFDRTGTIWKQSAYLKAPNANMSDYFGQCVGMSSNLVIVGAPNEDGDQNFVTNGRLVNTNRNSSNSGAGYLFEYFK